MSHMMTFVACSKLEKTGLDVLTKSKGAKGGKNVKDVISARYSHMILHHIPNFEGAPSFHFLQITTNQF